MKLRKLPCIKPYRIDVGRYFGFYHIHHIYKEHFEQQLTRQLDILKSKKKDISKIKSDISKLTTQKEKILELIINESSQDLIKVYKEKLESIISQISLHNDDLELYQSLDIDKEEKAIRKQFNLSHEDITYRDFQDLSREQLKVLFNYLIDHITIKEIEIFDNKKVILAVTIHLKLNGYAPKQTLEYLKNIRYTDEQKKTSKSQNETCLSLGGGEGGI